MVSSKIKYSTYGAIISFSLITLSVSATNTDGIFGDYFRNIINDADSCGTNTAITGFNSIPGANFAKQKCTTFDSIVRSVLGSSPITDGQAFVGFNPDGSPRYSLFGKACIGTGGINNTCDGISSLGLQTDGSSNTSYGAYSMSNKIVGDSNTAIGSYAASNLVTGNNNIAIGFASNFVLTSGSNQLNIGNWIYGNNGNIGIGIATPTSKLEVEGDIKAKNIYSNGKLVSANPPDCFGAGKLLQYKSSVGWICANNNGLLSPTLSFSRTCNGVPCTTVRPGDTHGANWTTTNTTTMSWKCTSGPADSTQLNKEVFVPTEVSNNFEGYDSLSAGGWTPGTYVCSFTLVGPGGTTVEPIGLTIAPNPNAPTLSFSRTCNGVPCTTVRPGDTHGANWTTTKTTTMSYKCTSGPADSTQINKEVFTATGVNNNYESYDSLSVGGWTPGTYVCAFTLVGPGGTTVEPIGLTVAPNITLPTLSFSRTCNGVPCTTVRPGDTHGANWTITNAISAYYYCSGPTGSPFVNKKISIPLNNTNNYQTYTELVSDGWIPGEYTCDITALYDGGGVSMPVPFVMAPPGSATVLVTRSSNSLYAGQSWNNTVVTSTGTLKLEVKCDKTPFTPGQWIVPFPPTGRGLTIERYDDMADHGYANGIYNCQWRASDKDGIGPEFGEQFYIQPRQ